MSTPMSQFPHFFKVLPSSWEFWRKKLLHLGLRRPTEAWSQGRPWSVKLCFCPVTEPKDSAGSITPTSWGCPLIQPPLPSCMSLSCPECAQG